MQDALYGNQDNRAHILGFGTNSTIDVYFEKGLIDELVYVDPGKIGEIAMDELFELLVLVQVGFKSRCKIYLYDTEFYAPLVEFFKKSFLKHETISEENLELFKLVDSVEEIISDVKLALKKEEI